MEQKIETPAGNFYIREYIDSDEEAVRSLWKSAFGRDINPGIWRWKYHRPFFGRRMLLCVNERDLPVVMFSCLPYPALYHGRIVNIGHAVDSMSHPGYRGHMRGRNGLFVLTTKKFFEQFGHKDDLIFIYGFPGERHFRLGSILLNYTRLTKPLLYFAWPSGYLKRRLRLFKGSVRLIEGQDWRLDGFARRMAQYYPFAVLRDSRFMNWRYDLHPLFSYQIFSYGSILGKKMNGYMVVRYEENVATIVDMVISPKNGDMPDFLEKVCGEIKERGINLVRTWLPKGHFLANALISSGITPDNEPFGIIPAAVEKDFDPGLSHKRAMEELFYTMADGDLV